MPSQLFKLVASNYFHYLQYLLKAAYTIINKILELSFNFVVSYFHYHKNWLKDAFTIKIG